MFIPSLKYTLLNHQNKTVNLTKMKIYLVYRKSVSLRSQRVLNILSVNFELEDNNGLCPILIIGTDQTFIPRTTGAHTICYDYFINSFDYTLGTRVPLNCSLFTFPSVSNLLINMFLVNHF